MSYAHTQRQKWIASKNTLPPEQMGKRVDAGRCGSAFSQAVWLFGASQGEPQGMSEGGLFLPATSLLVPCPTVCEPTFGVRRHLQDSCPANSSNVLDAATNPMSRMDSDYHWLPSNLHRRVSKGTWRTFHLVLGRGTVWPQSCHINNLVGIHLWEVVGVSALNFLGDLDLTSPLHLPDRWDRMLCHALRHQQTASPRRGIRRVPRKPSVSFFRLLPTSALIHL
jgi:hypothetical protein